MTNKIIIVSGPTASGKSSLAIDIAKILGSEIISSDSMQIYKGMNIGTAKITIDEMEGIKHHLIDIVNPDEEYCVSDFAEASKNIINELHSKDKIPVICGGTGLYIDSILYPLSLGAPKDELVRNQLNMELEKYGPEYLHDQLKLIDPVEAEKVHFNNTKRVIRALEIYRITGKVKSDFEDRNKKLNYETLLICLNPEREILYDRINQRVDNMFNLGLENEVKGLLAEGYDFSLQSMQAIGYKEFKDYFDNILTKQQLIDLIKKETRNYAKRQITWFKRYDFTKWFDPSNHSDIIDEINKFCEE